MNNFIGYKDNYSDTSGRLCGFKRDEITDSANVTNDDNAPSCSFIKQALLLTLKQMGQKRE